MKHNKIGLIAIIFLSGIILSGCGSKTAQNVSPASNQEQQTTTSGMPSGTPPEKDGGRGMNLTEAAKTLGVTEEALKTAIGVGETRNPEEKTETQGTKPSGEPRQIDFAAIAAKLGVTEEALKSVLMKRDDTIISNENN